MTTPEAFHHLEHNMKDLLRSIAEALNPAWLFNQQGVSGILTGIPFPLANLLVGGAVDRESVPEFARRLEERARLMEAPVAWVLMPGSHPEQLAEQLVERGWVLVDTMPGMCTALGDQSTLASPPDGVDIRACETEADLESVIGILEKGYPVSREAAVLFMEGIQRVAERRQGKTLNFLALLNGEPAACSSMHLVDGVAGIYCVATLEQYRGRGLGGAVTFAAMRAGFLQGAVDAILHATSMGEPVYRRLGFAEYARLPILVTGLSAH